MHRASTATGRRKTGVAPHGRSLGLSSHCGRPRRDDDRSVTSLYSSLTPEEMAANAANVARARAREEHRREALAARGLLLADLPWLDRAPMPEASIWRPLIDLAVQLTGPLHAWFWGGAVPTDSKRLVVPAGTRLARPVVVVHGPPVGAYVCEPVPEDGRDDEPWWGFRLQAPVGVLGVGALLEMRPIHAAVMVPDGHHAIGNARLTARAALAVDA
jgi:hypothetical protein